VGWPKPNQTIFWARFHQMVWTAKKWFYGLSLSSNYGLWFGLGLDISSMVLWFEPIIKPWFMVWFIV
jgi:hypothetical protein